MSLNGFWLWGDNQSIKATKSEPALSSAISRTYAVLRFANNLMLFDYLDNLFISLYNLRIFKWRDGAAKVWMERVEGGGGEVAGTLENDGGDMVVEGFQVVPRVDLKMMAVGGRRRW